MPLDDYAKKFLNSDDIVSLNNQKANTQRQLDFYEKTLLSESNQFGDAIILYVVNHHDLTICQRAFGFVLSILNVRDEYPDGPEMFDDCADSGGEQVREELKPPTVSQEKKSCELTTSELPRAAILAEKVTKYVTQKKNGSGLSNLQTAYGLGRAFHTLRLQFPAQQGGIAGFDAVALQAGDYFTKYKDS